MEQMKDKTSTHPSEKSAVVRRGRLRTAQDNRRQRRQSEVGTAVAMARRARLSGCAAARSCRTEGRRATIGSAPRRQRSCRVPRHITSSAKRRARRAMRDKRRSGRGSHHQRAMQPATAATVLGNFDGANLPTPASRRAFRRDGKYLARTDGPDGALHDYEVTHTFGVAPLQQYLVAFPGGRMQALDLAWTAGRRAPAGNAGSTSIPTRRSQPDPLHWTGVTESWNFMCADCHSTNVRKRRTRRAGSMRPGSPRCRSRARRVTGRVRTRRVGDREPGGERRAEHKGLRSRSTSATASPGRGSRDEQAGAERPRLGARDRDVRALSFAPRPHPRRQVHGQPVGDDYRVALLDDDLYCADGQIKGEVYEYGSFIQSRMFAAGVTCSDCHDPHRP